MPTNTTPSALIGEPAKERFELGKIPRPIGDRVLVMRDAVVTQSEGGILLPGAATTKPKQGRVIAVGLGRLLENGERAEMEVKVDDHVRFSSYAGTDLNGTEAECGYVVMREDDVMCINSSAEDDDGS